MYSMQHFLALTVLAVVGVASSQPLPTSVAVAVLGDSGGSPGSADAGTTPGRHDGLGGHGGPPHQGVQYFNAIDHERGAYRFGYDTGALDHQSFREETRSEDGVVRGSYGYVDSGVLRITEYVADQLGYRCQQSIRYLVEPNRGKFVKAKEPDFMKFSSKIQHMSPYRSDLQTNLGSSQNPEVKSGQRSKERLIDEKEPNTWDHSYPRATRKSWWNQEPKMQWQGAQPARVIGKKVAGLYKDFTSEPAVGGTAAVTSWDSAHNADLHDDELLSIAPESSGVREQWRTTIGGTSVWPTTEDGTRVVWHPL